MSKYVVGPGDTVMGLADLLRLPSIDPVWNHVENGKLKTTREPGALVPGDVLFLPENAPATYTLETGKRHRIVAPRPRTYLRLCLKDVHDEPIRNALFELTVGGKTSSGSTNGDGMLEMKVPPTSAELVLNIEGRTLCLRPGRLFPMGEAGKEPPAAINGRLHNLGYAPVSIDDQHSPRTERALRAFQRDHDLEETGKPDASTVDKLKALYGR